MKKEEIKENQFVWYASGEYFGILKNVRNAERGNEKELQFDMLMLHTGKVYEDIMEFSGMTSELKVVKRIDVLTDLTRSKATSYTTIGEHFKQIAIITQIEDKINQLPDE